MKSYFLPIVISMLCFCGSVSAQTKIAYAYDANGNLIKRSNNSILKSRSLQNLHEDNQKTYGDNEISIIEESPSGKYSIKTRDYIDGNKAVVRIYSDETWEDKWTKGFVLDCKKSTASQYTFKSIDNIEYLFVEWKMGNYVYGGAKPGYYVFTR